MDKETSERISKEFINKLDSLLENSEDFKVNSTDELVKEFNKYVYDTYKNTNVWPLKSET